MIVNIVRPMRVTVSAVTGVALEQDLLPRNEAESREKERRGRSRKKEKEETRRERSAKYPDQSRQNTRYLLFLNTPCESRPGILTSPYYLPDSVGLELIYSH